MQVKANKSDVEVSGYKLYTGLNNYRIIGINPDLKTIREKINHNASDTAADYKGKDNDGNDQVRIDFHLVCTDSSVKFKTKIAFFLSTALATTQNGGVVLIDNKGNWTRSDSLETVKENPKMDWMDKESLRQAHVGEPQLIDFLKAWLNVDYRDKDAVVYLEDPAKMAKKADVSEIKEIHKEFSKNEVRMLAFVRLKDDKRYQDFYRHVFTPPYIKDTRLFENALNNQYTALKPEQVLQEGFTFAEYTGNTSVGGGSEENPPSGELPPSQSGGYEDLDEIF
jgi:hypothetical protein